MNKDRCYGVDGNWYLHRVIHTQMFEPEDVAASQARRFLGMICNDAGAVGARRLAVAFDGGSVFRYDIDPSYKGKREKKADGTSAYEHLPFIKDFLKYAGIHVVHKPKYEADDVLCTWSHIHPNFVAGCGDKDGYQYVRSGCFLYNSASKPNPTRVHVDDVIAAFGVPPEQCVDYQTLIGDKIDNIPHLMNKDLVIAGLEEHGSIVKWAKASSGFRKWLRENEEAVKLNRKLVRLVPDIKDVTEIPPVKWSSDQTLTKGYHEFRRVADVKSKGLF
jgi:DNA polymerase I